MGKGDSLAFRAAWAKKEKQGYMYGRDALEQVRFGWDIAIDEVITLLTTRKDLKVPAYVASLIMEMKCR